MPIGQLANAIAGRLRDRIRAGEFPPGTRLPSINEVRQVEDVAKQTAHNAFKVLQDEGLAVAATGSGFYVADPLPPPRPPGVADLPLGVQMDQLRRRLDDVERRLDAGGL